VQWRTTALANVVLWLYFVMMIDVTSTRCAKPKTKTKAKTKTKINPIPKNHYHHLSDLDLQFETFIRNTLAQSQNNVVWYFSSQHSQIREWRATSLSAIAHQGV